MLDEQKPAGSSAWHDQDASLSCCFCSLPCDHICSPLLSNATAPSAQLSEEARLAGGSWQPLIPEEHPGIAEVKWCRWVGVTGKPVVAYMAGSSGRSMLPHVSGHA